MHQGVQRSLSVLSLALAPGVLSPVMSFFLLIGFLIAHVCAPPTQLDLLGDRLSMAKRQKHQVSGIARMAVEDNATCLVKKFLDREVVHDGDVPTA
jgi:hypothetical protein